MNRAVSNKKTTAANKALERKEILREQEARRFAEDSATFNDRLIKVLIGYATLKGFSVQKGGDDSITLRSTNVDGGGYNDTVQFVVFIKPTDYENLYRLECAEREISDHYKRFAEDARMKIVRVAARAKLTDEDAKALGLC